MIIFLLFFPLHFLLSLPATSPPPPPPPPPPSPQLMQFCDLCYVDAQTSGFVGLGIKVFSGLCVHYFCVPCCEYWYEHSLKSVKPFESWKKSLSLSHTFVCVCNIVWHCDLCMCHGHSQYVVTLINSSHWSFFLLHWMHFCILEKNGKSKKGHRVACILDV